MLCLLSNQMVGTPHTEWPAKGPITPIHGAILSLLKEHKAELPNISSVACDARCRDSGTMDIFLFHKWDKTHPIGFVGISEATVDKLVPYIQALETAGDDAADSGTSFVAPDSPYEVLPIPYDTLILTCAHVQRDMRCGYCGSLLHDQIVAEVDKRGLKGKVFTGRVSHVGGHAFAGNVIVYPEGAWYGYVRPADVPRIFDEHIGKGALLMDKLRGILGLSKSENAAIAQQAAAEHPTEVVGIFDRVKGALGISKGGSSSTEGGS